MESTAQQQHGRRSNRSGKVDKKLNRFTPYNNKEKNQCENGQNGELIQHDFKQLYISPYAPAVVRLLARRFALTNKKYIEIGINIKKEKSYVEIAMGEIFKKEIIFNLKDWLKLMEYEPLITEYFKPSTITENQPIFINLTTTIVLKKYKDIKVIYFFQANTPLILAKSSFKSILRLNDCVNSYFKVLSETAETINGKIDTLKNVKDIKNHKDFNQSSTIDSELLALHFSK